MQFEYTYRAKAIAVVSTNIFSRQILQTDSLYKDSVREYTKYLHHQYHLVIVTCCSYTYPSPNTKENPLKNAFSYW